jgi:glycolate oxidase FAD binding subunit
MTDTLKPRDSKDIEAAVQWAIAENKSLEVVGQGTKRALGRPAQWDATLDVSKLSGVTLYEPEELVLSARAGTAIAEIERLTRSRNQELAFEPMDFGPLLGGLPGRGTIGGVLAANLSGPRRLKAGAARDHFLGVSAVSGRGEAFKSGGRVVKNVTGYDLCKLLAGSWGTLAVMTDITLKTLPKAEAEASLLVLGLEPAVAVRAMAAAMGASCDVSGAAHLPLGIAARVSDDLNSGRSVTALRLEGVELSVAHRVEMLTKVMAPFGALEPLRGEPSYRLWRAIRDVLPFAADGPTASRPIWRISTAPLQGAELAHHIAERADAEFLFDWAGGLLWVAPVASDDASEIIVRDAVEACGGYAMLVRAPAAIRATVPVFEPQQGAIAALTARVKEGFDPRGVLNPGRMWPGV